MTPPDVISQIGVALPTILLYEISIIAVSMVQPAAVEEEDDDDDDDDDDNDNDNDDDNVEGEKKAEAEEATET